MRYIADCHDILGRSIEEIMNGNIASIEQIDNLWRSSHAK